MGAASTHSFHKIVIFGGILAHIQIIVILIESTFAIRLYINTVSYLFFALSFVDHHYWISWTVQKALEMHGVMYVGLGIDSFIETKVIMPLL